jgi:hypothetical protein
MAKTRAKKPTPSKPATASQESEVPNSRHRLQASESNPPKTFILPKGASAEARIVTFPHPVTSKPHRYYVDPERGFYEFTRIAAPKKACRSILFAPDFGDDAALGEEKDGHVLQAPDVFVATPIDARFLLLPAFHRPQGEAWGTFFDRLFQDADGAYDHLRSVFRSESGKKLERETEDRMRDVCDCVDMGDDSTYTLNKDKLGKLVYTKAERMVERGLPASMEEHFVKKPLEVPEASMRREDSGVSIVDADTKEGATHNAATSVMTHDQAQLVGLLRLKTAIAYLCKNYVPLALAAQVTTLFTAQSSTKQYADFSPLNTHLAHLAKLKSEAQALRSISDNISRKRSGVDDDEAMEKAETKKRKKEEEEARKKNVSLGVKKLAKADMSGMKKLSSFFTKPVAGKKT